MALRYRCAPAYGSKEESPFICLPGTHHSARMRLANVPAIIRRPAEAGLLLGAADPAQELRMARLK